MPNKRTSQINAVPKQKVNLVVKPRKINPSKTKGSKYA